MADLSQLPPATLTERGITAHIASRYHQGMPFSTISTRTLVAVNTFTNELDINQDQVFKDMAARVQNRMAARSESQCVVFLGENGSGKSEYAACLMRNLLTLANNPLSTRVRSVQPVMDAFSTAKTATSLASSRAGLIRELQYDHEANLVGAAVYDYRLERQRVTKVATNERNYQVFYYMVNGLSDAERHHLHLENREFRYLGHPSQLHLSGVDDRLKFKQLKLALYSLGFSRADVANIFQVLAAILHLGQLQFKGVLQDASVSATVAVEIVNMDVVETIAQFLGVMPEILTTSIIAKTVYVNHDRVTVVLDQRGAREQADSLARTLYTMLFSYLTDRINNSLALDPDSPDIATTISLCDFPGFQPSTASAGKTGPRQQPQLDRLLHNCANEMLYNYLVHVYFRAPEDVLESEEVDVPGSEFFDNAETVKTLAKPHTGVLAVINEYAKRDRDDIALRDSLRRRFPNSSSVAVDGSDFTVNHYAGEASYSIEGLLEGAREILSTDVISLFVQSSSNDFLRQVFQAAAVIDTTVDDTVVEAHLASEPRRQQSVRRDQDYRNPSGNDPQHRLGGQLGSVRRSGSVRNERKHIRKFSNPLQKRGRVDAPDPDRGQGGILEYINSLDTAIDAMENSHAYFVLALKPNDNRLVSSLDARCVRQQVSALGIPELAQRTRNTDLSVFIPFSEFMRHWEQHHDTSMQSQSEVERDAVGRCIEGEGWTSRDAVLGITGVFLSEAAWIQLVDPELRFADEAAAKYTHEIGDFHDVHAYSDLETRSLAGGFGNMFSLLPKREAAITPIGDTKEVDPDAVDFTAPPHESAERKTWLTIVWMYTFWYPTALIRGTFASVKLAWREKLAINLIIWGICASSMIILIGLPYFICPIQNVISVGQLNAYSYDNKPDHVMTSIRGTVYDITKFASSHYPGIVPRQNILKYGGKDSSDLFPVPVSAVCSLVTNDMVVIGDPHNYTDSNAQYHDFRAPSGDYRPDWYLQHMHFFNTHYLRTFIGYTPKDVQNLVDKSKSVVSLDGYVYDLTDYLSGNIFDMSNSTNKQNDDTQFLNTDVVNLIQQFMGQDITKRFKQLNLDDKERFETVRCLRNLFMMGKLDIQNSTKCLFARYWLLGITCFVVLVILCKFVAALQFGNYEYPDDLDKFVICQVPAYTEDEESLRRAIDSLTRTKYDDKRKLLVVVCDGMIVGAGNEKPTPRIVLDILGHPEDVDPPALSFESLGDGDEQHNYGKIYTGLYETGGHIVPYLVVVKVGKPTEVFRPGNRGKRDSQLLLMRFLNRVHYNSPMNPLELEMYHQIQDVIGVAPSYYGYLMQVDADTVVSPESLSQLMGKLVRDTRIQAICGETELSNARHSLITMIQVYEYYISHNLAKAFESLFGTVTCLPGCFSLYRLFEEDSGRPLLVSNPVIDCYSENSVRTLHMKNLLQLGEDRYLTTLLLKFNPRFSTKFLRHAHAYTVAPDSWSVLLSQRRRWINSTVHNMVELVPMSQMCGFCCFSMRFMVLIDLLSTFLQPVTLGYIIYLIYLVCTRHGTVPWSSIALLGAVYGLQIIIFILRLRWEMIGWMFIYLLALPIHSFLLPLYSFWHMDDFSWGNTRMVVGEKGKKMLVNDEGHFDPSEIPLKPWKDYEDEHWTHNYSEGLSHGRIPSDSYSIAPTAFMATEDPFSDSHRSPGAHSGSTSPRPPPMSTSMASMSAAAGGNSIPTDHEVTEAIRKILADGDLTKVTKRSVRDDLEQKFGVSFSNRKEYISWVIEALLSGEL